VNLPVNLTHYGYVVERRGCEQAGAAGGLERTVAPALTMTRGRNTRGNTYVMAGPKFTAGELVQFIEANQTNQEANRVPCLYFAFVGEAA